jgi:hypothetical protein
LLLLGEHFYYARHVEEMVARVRDIRQAILPGGRFCMTWEHAEEIAARAMHFLAS